MYYVQKQNLQMQKFKEKERNSIVNARNHNKDEYRCVTRTSLGGLIQSAPTIIQIAGKATLHKYMSAIVFPFDTNLETIFIFITTSVIYYRTCPCI